jgi:hypothetical protein
MLCVPAELFKTTYAFDLAGAVMFLVTVPFAVHNNTALRASLSTPLTEVNVTSASVDSVVVPAMEASTNEVILLFTVSPHVPDSSPVAGRASPKSDVYAVAISKLLFVYQFNPQAVWTGTDHLFAIIQLYSVGGNSAGGSGTTGAMNVSPSHVQPIPQLPDALTHATPSGGCHLSKSPSHKITFSTTSPRINAYLSDIDYLSPRNYSYEARTASAASATISSACPSTAATAATTA